MNERPEWFGPKTYGYGSGLPIRWQGWLLLLGFGLIVVLGAIFIAPRSELAFVALVLPALILFVMITKQTTRGGWRWRWGDKE